MKKWIEGIPQLILPLIAVASMECVRGDMRVSIIFFIIVSVWVSRDIILILTTIVMAGVALLSLNIPYSWIPYLVATLSGAIQICFLYKKKKEDKADRVAYAQERAKIVAEKLNTEICSLCHKKHLISIEPKINKDNRICFTYSSTEDCPEINEKTYNAICRLEHEINKEN